MSAQNAAAVPGTSIGTPGFGRPLSAAMLAAAASVVMLFGALAAAYLAFREPLGGTLVDPAMKFNNYAGVMSVFTMLLASLAAAWAATSARLGKRRWASAGFGLACIVGAAALNLVWFIGTDVKLPVVSSPYTVLLFSLLVIGGLAILGGIVASLIGFASTFGGHAGAESPIPARALALGQHAATVAWILTFVMVFLKK